MGVIVNIGRLAVSASPKFESGEPGMSNYEPARRAEGRMGSGIYMDYQASTPLDPRIAEAMTPYWTEYCGNTHSSEHAFGWAADDAVEGARAKVAYIISADPDEIFFTSGATEANNIALLGMARAAGPTRRKVIVSAIEHKSVLAAARALTGEGFEIAIIPVSADGIIDLGAITAAIDGRTALVSVMAVNNEVGTTQPLRQIADICQVAGVPFHVDAAQALTFLSIDVAEIGIDLMSLSAHKCYGPKGVGAIFVRRGLSPRPRPLAFGGGQEGGLRPGTLPVPLCVGFGEACSILERERTKDTAHASALGCDFLRELRTRLTDVRINGTMVGRHPGNLNLHFPGVEASLLLNALQPHVAASSGSACTSGFQEPSHVLRAMGLTPLAAASSVRFGIGRFTTEADIIRAADLVASAVASLRLAGAA